MAKVCPKCGREFGSSSMRCPICKCSLVDDGIDNSEEARKERLKALQQKQIQAAQTVRQAQGVNKSAGQYVVPTRNKDIREAPLKTWKLVSGILSTVLFVFVAFQSCAAGLGNAIANNGESSGSGGIIVALLMLSGGIVSIATRNSKKNGGNISLIVLFGIAALVGFAI